MNRLFQPVRSSPVFAHERGLSLETDCGILGNLYHGLLYNNQHFLCKLLNYGDLRSIALYSGVYSKVLGVDADVNFFSLI